MKPKKIPDSVKQQLLNGLSLTHDGIGIFDADDRLVYCNRVLASMFSLSPKEAMGQTFDALVRHSFTTDSGINLDSNSVDSWLRMAHRLRRSKKFRSFEMDYQDGRCFLVTEHTADDQSILVFCSEITEQKQNERELNRLNQQLEILANFDSLTGIYNRRHFLDLAAHEISRCARERSDLALIMLDLDHFKSINDNYGHEIGDQVLVGSVQRIKEQLRDYDLFGRLGGEEFTILLPGSDIEDGIEIGDRIATELRDRPIQTRAGEIPMTCSIGVAQYNHSGGTLGELIDIADQYLYQAKQAGRSRVVGQPRADDQADA